MFDATVRGMESSFYLQNNQNDIISTGVIIHKYNRETNLMAVDEITRKLNELIIEEGAFAREEDVIYFLVQLRKLMEREDILNEHRGVKFYCDWIVHPVKNGNHDDLASIYSSIYEECEAILRATHDGSSDHILSLLQFDQLKQDIRPLLVRYNLSPLLTDKLWIKFTKSLLSILKDQPLEKRNGNISGSIKKIVITRAYGDEFEINIVFVNPILGHPEFNYGLEYHTRKQA